jgi:hypothetical protein
MPLLKVKSWVTSLQIKINSLYKGEMQSKNPKLGEMPVKVSRGQLVHFKVN